jgi:small subunit ribosomal protein S16
MLTIRLQRRGRRNLASFRVVVQERSKATNSSVIEILGFLNPHTDEKSLKLDRIKHWIDNGAMPSARMHNMLVDEGVITTPKVRTQRRMKGEQTADATAPTGAAKSETAKPAAEQPAEVKS